MNETAFMPFQPGVLALLVERVALDNMKILYGQIHQDRFVKEKYAAAQFCKRGTYISRRNSRALSRVAESA